MHRKERQNKWTKGNGEMISFAIISIAICSIFIILVSFLQLSIGLNTITKASNVVARSVAVCTSKKDAEKQAQLVAENAINGSHIKNIRASITYATNNKEWQPGTFIKVTIRGKVKTLAPFRSFKQSKSVLVSIEGTSGIVTNIPEQYNGFPIGENTTHTHYEEPKIGQMWTPGTRQRKLYDQWVDAGKTYEDKIATYNGYYLIACSSKFGTVGDKVQFTLENGEIINCIVADAKDTNDSNYTEYGHISTGKILVLEFQVHKECGGINPASNGWKMEWHSRPVKAKNMGSIF